MVETNFEKDEHGFQFEKLDNELLKWATRRVTLSVVRRMVNELLHFNQESGTFKIVDLMEQGPGKGLDDEELYDVLFTDYSCAQLQAAWEGWDPDEEVNTMKTFTFGFDHKHPVTNESLARHYIQVPGDWDMSRQIMMAVFGREWAFQYESPQKLKYLDKMSELEWTDELRARAKVYESELQSSSLRSDNEEDE